MTVTTLVLADRPDRVATDAAFKGLGPCHKTPPNWMSLAVEYDEATRQVLAITDLAEQPPCRIEFDPGCKALQAIAAHCRALPALEA